MSSNSNVDCSGLDGETDCGDNETEYQFGKRCCWVALGCCWDGFVYRWVALVYFLANLGCCWDNVVFFLANVGYCWVDLVYFSDSVGCCWDDLVYFLDDVEYCWANKCTCKVDDSTCASLVPSLHSLNSSRVWVQRRLGLKIALIRHSFLERNCPMPL